MKPQLPKQEDTKPSHAEIAAAAAAQQQQQQQQHSHQQSIQVCQVPGHNFTVNPNELTTHISLHLLNFSITFLFNRYENSSWLSRRRSTLYISQ